jgi:hypothetical protein
LHLNIWTWQPLIAGIVANNTHPHPTIKAPLPKKVFLKENALYVPKYTLQYLHHFHPNGFFFLGDFKLTSPLTSNKLFWELHTKCNDNRRV